MIEREALNTVKNISETFRVLLVTGPRQVGKTTLLKQNMPKNMNYVTLDDKILRQKAKEDPKLFLKEHPYPLLIDEVQYAPELFPYIKMIVDEKNERGMYWLTGSQQFVLMKNVTESLAGRVGIVNLNSLTYREINQNIKYKVLFNPTNLKKTPEINVNELFELIFKGGYPELYNIPNMNRKKFFEGYVKTYISRDVKEQVDVKDLLLFRKFIIAMASRNGEQLNYTNIANDIGVSDNTVRTWVDVLVTSGIIYLLEPYMNSKLKRVTHMPKIVFMDTGLCAYLAGWDSARELQLSETSGHYLETYIVSEIIKSYNSEGIEPNISYYRDKDKNEIDLIIFKNNKLYPFEIKKTASPTKEMIKKFEKLKLGTKELGEGGIICLYDTLMHLDENNFIIPVSSVLNAKNNEK